MSTSSGRLRFDRIDRVALEVLLAIVWVASAVVMVGGPLRRWIVGGPVVVDVDARAAGIDRALEGAQVPLEVDGAYAGLRLVELLSPAIAVLALGAGALLLAGVVRRITVGDAFHPSNVTRLRLLAGLLIAAPAVVAVVELAESATMISRLDLPATSPSVTIPAWGFVGGLATAAVAQAFAAGTQLRADTEGLV